jgi:hypothetical protein
MNKLTLQTVKYTKYGTFGVFILDNGIPALVTVEREWKDNRPYIKGKQSGSCIPAGWYDVEFYIHPTWGKTWVVKDVPNRSDIMIHPANYMKQLQGCVAPGMNYGIVKGHYGVHSSRVGIELLHDHYGEEPFSLEVIR